MRTTTIILTAATLTLGVALAGPARAEIPAPVRADAVASAAAPAAAPSGRRVYFINSRTYCMGSSLVTKEITYWSDGWTSAKRSTISDVPYCRERAGELARR
jgi:hypothetical protein